MSLEGIAKSDVSATGAGSLLLDDVLAGGLAGGAGAAAGALITLLLNLSTGAGPNLYCNASQQIPRSRLRSGNFGNCRAPRYKQRSSNW